MGKSQRDKGLRVEREFVNRHRDAGVSAERVPLSGAAGGSYTGDLIVTLPGLRPLNVEVKSRQDGKEWAWVARTLEGHDALYLRQDRREPLVVVPWHVWEDLTRAICLAARGLIENTEAIRWPFILPTPVGRPTCREPNGATLRPGH